MLKNDGTGTKPCLPPIFISRELTPSQHFVSDYGTVNSSIILAILQEELRLPHDTLKSPLEIHQPLGYGQLTSRQFQQFTVNPNLQ